MDLKGNAIICLFGLVIVISLTHAAPRAKSHRSKHHTRQSVPDNPEENLDNRNKGKQAKLDKEKNEATSPKRPKPSPEGIPPQAVGVKVKEHPRKQQKGKKNKEELEGFPLKGVQSKIPEKDKAKNKKYPPYEKNQGKVPVQGPPQYPPVEIKVSPPLPDTISVGKPQAQEPAPSNSQNQSNQVQANQNAPQGDRPQQKSKVHHKEKHHHRKEH